MKMNMTVNWKKSPESDTKRQRGRHPVRRLSRSPESSGPTSGTCHQAPQKGQAPTPGLHSHLSDAGLRRKRQGTHQVQHLGLREGIAPTGAGKQ